MQSPRSFLTTRECANRLGVSTDFVVGEIRDQRLVARTMTRPSGRTLYRVEVGDLEAYIDRYWTKAA